MEQPTLPQAISSEVVHVTPVLAEQWLSRNCRNRKVNRRTVAMYARAMQRGEWMLTGEAIKFASSGDLLDGQHRLAAIVETGVTVPLLVIYGLPPMVQDVLDTGRKRSAGDQLAIHGVTSASSSAAGARLILLYQSGKLRTESETREPVTHREIVDFAVGNDELARAVLRADVLRKEVDMRQSVGVLAYYVLHRRDSEACDLFFTRLVDPIELPHGSAILALRKRLHQLRAERYGRTPEEAHVSLVFRAWNAWRTDRLLQTLPLMRGGSFIPAPEPR